MPQLFSNAARAELDTPIAAQDVSLLLTGGGSLFPACNYTGQTVLSADSNENWFKIVIQDEDNFEIAYCYKHVAGSDTLEFLKRGMEGTPASAFGVGAIIGIRPVAGDASFIVEAIRGVKENKADKSGNVATASKLKDAFNIAVGEVTVAIDGSGDVSLSLDDIGAAPKEHNHSLATSTSNGFMSKEDKTKLTGIEASATKNSTDAVLLSPVNHTGAFQYTDNSINTAVVLSRNAITALPFEIKAGGSLEILPGTSWSLV